MVSVMEVKKSSDLDELPCSVSNSDGFIDKEKLFDSLTFGSFNRKNDEFKHGWLKEVEFGLGQCNCIVIVAWMFHFKYKPYEWDASHLDNIICKGDWLQFTLLCDNEDEPHTSKYLQNIRAACLFRKEHFVFEPVMQLSFSGKFTGLRSKLKNYMNRCDENSRSVLLTCKQISFEIFGYIGGSGQIEYCLFDSNGRNSNGFFDYSGNSCVMVFKSIDNLMNLLARDALFSHCRYECVPIKKNVNIIKSHYVNVHNSKTFVKKYCSVAPDLSDSSGSSDIETDDDADDGIKANGNNGDVSVVQTAKRNSRTTKAPERFTHTSHPSFSRGTLRENQKRSKRKWKEWYNARGSEQKKTYRAEKKIMGAK